MGNIKENILVNFSRKSKYTSDTSFVGIKFGADAQLTELELIELQEILRGQITSSLKNLIGDKFLKEKPECIYADKVITLKKGKMLIQGYYAEADNLVLKDVVNEDYIAVKGEIVEIKHSDNIPKWGNNSEASNIVILPNYIQDEDLKGETSRRYQLVFKLVKVKPDSQGKVDGLLVGHIVNSKLILDAPVADFDSLDKDITEVGDILRKELKDLQEDLSMHKNDASRIEREIREILENYSTTLNGYTEEHNKIHIELDKVLKTKINESDAIKLIDEHAKLKKEIVEVLPNPLDAKPNTIYLVKKEDGKDGDFYNEYVIIDKKFELIGNTSLDLTGYAKKTDIPERLGQLEDDLKLQESIKGLSDGKVDKVGGKQLSTNDYTTEEKTEVAKIKDKADITELNKKIDKTSITSDLSGTSETLVISQKAGNELKKSVSNGKELVANAVTQKGVATNKDDSFAKIVGNINNIKVGDYSIGDILEFEKLEEAKQKELKEVWSFTGHTGDANSVAVDNQGFIYSGSNDKTVKKISPDGKQIWSFTGHTDYVKSVAVDNQGFVYSGSRDKTVKKISPDGKQIWSFTGHTSNVNLVAVDNQGFVYSCSNDKTVKKISPDGKQIWSFTGHIDWVNSVAVGNQGFVYSGGDDKTVKKISPDGKQIWSFTGHTDYVKSVAVDNQGFIYSGSNDKTVKKISPDGKQIWSFTGHTGGVQSVAVDNQGFIYSGSSDTEVKKISPDGKEVWSFTDYIGNWISSVAVDSQGFVYSSNYNKTVKKITNKGATYGYKIIK